ncbi:MAG: PLP-dependent transferase [Kiloniellales bacterium]|nr:PLP-dependent transferase [Kiloniellales bacterium]
MTDRSSLKPETLAAHGLYPGDPVTGAVIPPVQPATTFARDERYALLQEGMSYARDANPTYLPAEGLLARLEGGEAALVFSSGNAAASTVIQSLEPGDRVVAPKVMYWGLRGRFGDFASRWGLDFALFDAHEPDGLARAIEGGRTRLVWIETPSNPTWDVIDIAAAAALAHAAGARLAVDSTVATPVLSRPLEHGADLVMHSATKYLNGHSDVVAGALATARRDEFWQRIETNRAGGGAILGSFEAWLLQRGLRTLYLRVGRACESALAIARHFDGDPRLSAVLYPGLPSHPGHAVAARQMSGGFGGMLSLRVAGGAGPALATAKACRLFLRATSLGGVESLIEHRATIEGPGSPIPEDLLRLSIGIEHPDDLIADLDQALPRA